MISIRALSEGEGELWRMLRMRALRDAPDAFRTTIADVATWSDASWARQADDTAGDPDRVLLVADDDGTAVGVAFSSVRGDEASVGAMWVDPSARGRGVGRRLVEAALTWARAKGCDHAVLSVTVGNAAAMRLYEGCGFVATGSREPLRHGSNLECEHMRRSLRV